MFTPHRLALDDLRERGAPVDSRLLRLAMQGPTTRDSEGRGSSATGVLRLNFAMHQLPRRPWTVRELARLLFWKLGRAVSVPTPRGGVVDCSGGRNSQHQRPRGQQEERDRGAMSQ